MKYSMLATALTLTLGSGIALASQSPEAQDSEDPADTPATTAPLATSPDQSANDSKQQGKGMSQAAAEDKAKSLESVDLLFDFDSADLESGARTNLLTLARWAKCNPKGAIILEGHADPRGGQAYNMKLSGERAASVREKLVQMGVPSERIVVTLYGENGPRRDTFAEDRRVTVRASATPVEPHDITAEK
jgi:outer membrane protein OmpA-like peptidoglycan-associated protein